MNKPPHESRVSAVQTELQESEADGLVLFPSPNLTYLSGFSEEPMERHLLLFITANHTAFLAPELYESQLKEETPIRPITMWADGQDPKKIIETVTDDIDLDCGHVLVDDRMWSMFTQDLREAIPNGTFGLASEIMSGIRIQKDEYELNQLQEAARMSDEGSSRVRSLGEDVVGMTEEEVVTELQTILDELGSEGFSFDPIVAAGPNGAKPHYRHGNREIQSGDPVVLDFGGFAEGYAGDQTRTVVFDGQPPQGFIEAHDAVRRAVDAGVGAAKPGVEAQEVDNAARESLAAEGLAGKFIHRTGHGVGLEVHEPPYIVDGNEKTLRPGMVFSVEPGVYFEGKWGVRIEDLVKVTDEGAERLNQSPRTWKPL